MFRTGYRVIGSIYPGYPVSPNVKITAGVVLRLDKVSLPIRLTLTVDGN